MTDMKDKNCSKLTKRAEEVIKVEEKYIKKKRNSSYGNEYWGLGISGGGIRSASFGLGVMQALVANKPKSLLKRIDYLSTVSGGGYIGAALTWFLQKGLPDEGQAGTEPGNFPLGQIGSGARTKPERNLVLDFIRQHGNYLIPGKGLNTISLFGVVLRSMFVSLFFYLALFTIVMTGLDVFHAFDIISAKKILNLIPGLIFETGFVNSIALGFLIWLAIAIIGLLVLAGFLYSIRTFFSKRGVRRYKSLIFSQRWIGWAWSTILVLLLFGSLPYVPNIWKQVTAGSATFLGSVMGFWEFRKVLKPPKSENGDKFAGLRVIIAAFALIYGLLLTAFMLSPIFTSLWYFIGLVIVTGVFGFFINLNYVSPHRMYRNRLMETFMPNAENVKKNQWGPATKADGALLEGMCKKSPRPYHLINTNIVLVDSETAKFHGRGGDSYLLSPLFCGSDATCYVETKDYMKEEGRGMTLATAMAISGAAVNPNTGVAGNGVTRNRIVSILMGLLNLRLGYWATNPRFNKYMSFPPNFFVPGLTGDLLGSGLSEKEKYIELSDGGHFENLALYELIRRKAHLIIISDAGADPKFRFGDLANAVERIRVDFGVKIRFDPKCDIDGLLPGSAKDGSISDKYQLSERGFAMAEIKYPGVKNPGKLVYLKTTLTKDLPADIYGYKSANPSFPDQTTADQFFDEEQFESYRELGYILTKQMLNSKEGKKVFGLSGIST